MKGSRSPFKKKSPYLTTYLHMYKLLYANQSAVTESKLIDASTVPMDYKQA